MKHSGGPLDNQTWQTEWKTAPLAKVQLCEYENQTLEAFVAASRLYTKFDCPVAMIGKLSYCSFALAINLSLVCPSWRIISGRN